VTETILLNKFCDNQFVTAAIIVGETPYDNHFYRKERVVQQSFSRGVLWPNRCITHNSRLAAI